MATSYLFHWTQLVVFRVQDSEKYQVSKISTNNLLIWMLSISLKTMDLWFLWDSPTKYLLSIIKTSWISWIKLKILIEFWINIINSNNVIEFSKRSKLNHHSSPLTYRLGVDNRKIRIGYFNAGEGETDYIDGSKNAG